MDWKYSEWLPNRAGTCPVHPQMIVRCRMGNGEIIGPVPAGDCEWGHDHADPILRYQFPLWGQLVRLHEIAQIRRPVTFP